jgi:hypothetical protein
LQIVGPTLLKSDGAGLHFEMAMNPERRVLILHLVLAKYVSEFMQNVFTERRRV